MLPRIRRPRPWVAAAVAVSLIAAVPAAAAVRNEHVFKLTLTAKKPNRSTGVTFSTDRASYTAPAPGTEALRVTRTVFALPAGTKINVRAATPCSVATLKAQGSAGCRTGSAIGTGSAVAITNVAALPRVTEKVEVFATRTGLVAFLSGLQTVVLPLSVKGNKITANLPQLCVGGSAPPCAVGEAVLKTLKIVIRPKTKGKGAKAKRLITTPASCIGRKWTSRASYTYANGDTDVQKSTATCRR